MVSPTAAFVMLDVGPPTSHCFVSCMELWAVATHSRYTCLHDMTWYTGQVKCLASADCFLCFETVCLLALEANGCYT